jgi:hypothetical protein
MEMIRTIIAVTGEDERFAPVLESAMQRARDEHATLVLYDLDAPQSPLESPVPTEWSAEGTEDDMGGRLGPEELEASGHAAIADQVRRARDEGLDAWGWLPEKADRETLLSFAADEPGALLLVPAGAEDLDLGDLPEAEQVPTGAGR